MSGLSFLRLIASTFMASNPREKDAVLSCAYIQKLHLVATLFLYLPLGATIQTGKLKKMPDAPPKHGITASFSQSGVGSAGVQDTG